MLDPSQLGGDRIRPLRRVEFDRLVALGAFADGERIELLRGSLVAMSPQGSAHAEVVRRLTNLLPAALAGRALVQVQSPLAADDESEPEPDIAVVPAGDYTADHPARALWILEVSDTSLEKDLGPKAQLYAEMAVTEYWVVNLREACVERFRSPDAGRWERRDRIRAGTIAPEAFPDVSIDVARLLPSPG